MIGAGGMGAVFDAEDLETGRRVALKVLGQTLDLPEARERFFREGRLAASINHPNSVYVFGTEEIAGTPVIAMELVSGGTLQERVQKRGPLPVGEAVDATLQIIAGLEAAQRVGILHRDVKPSNCFRTDAGAVKIGDFGLSISTTIRLEPTLTATGLFLGTPAFCSPEQLRGDELNARSDMYSVGATLFYLLTGRTPFEGKSAVQLLATVLEQPAPSPRQSRPEIPRGLASAVERCLQKEPGDRFKSYAELSSALVPYSSTAATPATLGLRFVAGMMDMLVLGLISGAVMLLSVGSPMDFLDFATRRSSLAFTYLVGWMCFCVVYYAASESYWGATLGKAICKLRVVGPDKNAPRLLNSMLRAGIYAIAPVLPSWIYYGPRIADQIGTPNTPIKTVIGFSFYLVVGLLFCSARRRNGFAALHDLATNTRVVSRRALESRPSLTVEEVTPAVPQTAPRLGPYHVIGQLEGAPGGSSTAQADSQWLLGYDLRLLRKVWIRVVAPGTPPVSVGLRNLGRVGRLRWLSGRRSSDENWDAYEALSGKPLVSLIQTVQPWSDVRYWLSDLATELSASEKNGIRPDILDLDRVWITADGRARLLDFPSPGTTGTYRSSGSAPPLVATSQQFLNLVANAALQGSAVSSGASPARPLPLHASEFLAKLVGLADADLAVSELAGLLQRPACVSRLRRAAIVAGCAAFPIFCACSLALGMVAIEKWRLKYPGLFDLNNVLFIHSSMNRWGSKINQPTDKDFEVYVSSHYGELIRNRTNWSAGTAALLINGGNRKFAERSVAEYPAPTAEEVTAADAAIARHLPKQELLRMNERPWFPFVSGLVVLVLFVGIPSMAAAVAFRRGLVLRIAGVTLVRRDGKPASRLRLFSRSLVTWVPIAGALVLVPFIAAATGLFTVAATVPLVAALTGASIVVVLATVSLMLPDRGLADRVVGTWPVPR
jgi:uncharacterized RDD family membrane protein YckC